MGMFSKATTCFQKRACFWQQNHLYIYLPVIPSWGGSGGWGVDFRNGYDFGPSVKLLKTAFLQ